MLVDKKKKIKNSNKMRYLATEYFFLLFIIIIIFSEGVFDFNQTNSFIEYFRFLIHPRGFILFI